MVTHTVLTCREEETTFHIGTRKDKILFTSKWVDAKEPVFSDETDEVHCRTLGNQMS